MYMNIVAVDVNKVSIYGFLPEGETEQELLNRANAYKQKDIDTWDKNRKLYPCEQYEKYYNEALKVEYKIMSYDEYETLKKGYYLNQPIIETTKEIFDDMLNVLPPMKWCTIDGVNMFCMSEMITGTYTNQYARYNGNYYTKIVDITDRDTWINNYLEI